MIMNTPDSEDREYYLSKALKLPSNRMELFFVLHSYIVAKARDPLPPDQAQATSSIFGLFTWVEKADGIVRDVENSVESPSWVGAMMRTMLDSCKVCLLHKMGLRDEAITLAEKTRAIIEKEMTAKHYGIGYQCATVAISKVYEQLNNPELLQGFLHTMEYVADVFVSMRLKLNETKQMLNTDVSSVSPPVNSSSIVELSSSTSSSPQPTTAPLGTDAVPNASSLPLGLDSNFLYMVQSEDPNLLYNVSEYGQSNIQSVDFSNLDSVFQSSTPISADAVMGLELNLSGQF
jgi:hypothetical protein